MRLRRVPGSWSTINAQPVTTNETYVRPISPSNQSLLTNHFSPITSHFSRLSLPPPPTRHPAGYIPFLAALLL
jgi:hypothetical protein